VKNWPDANLVHELRGVVGLDRVIGDAERQRLRNSQINTMIEIDSKVYCASGGLSLSGVGIDSVRQSDMVVIAPEDFARAHETDPQSIISQAVASGPSWPASPSFGVQFNPVSFGVVEIVHHTCLRLGP
jgi:hypothetical protein